MNSFAYESDTGFDSARSTFVFTTNKRLVFISLRGKFQFMLMHDVVLDNMPENNGSKTNLTGDIEEYVNELRVQFGLDNKGDKASDSESERVAA